MAMPPVLRLITSSPCTITQRNILAIQRRLLSTEAGGAGDPRVHSGGAPSDDYTDRPPKFSGAEEATSAHDKHATPPPSASTKERVPPFAPSGRLGSQEVAHPTEGSSFTQKRRWSHDAHDIARDAGETEAARKGREEDREYYKTHKPSPIAELEFADTRKPIRRATDGGATDRYDDDPGLGVMEADTVDATLARAEAMFREAAARGNPAWPHSRALAAMLGRRGEGAAGSSAPWAS